MKTTKTSMKCLITMFVMAIAFVVTGFTSQAASPTVVTNWTNIPTDASVMHTVNFAAGQENASEQFTIPGKGTVWIIAAANSYVDMNLNGTELMTSNDGSVTDRHIYFTQGGTYTLTMSRSSYQAKDPAILQYYIYFFNSGDSSINAGQTTAFYSQNSSDYSYTKITVKNAGYIKVETPEADNYGVNVTLLNSKKKAISDEIYASASYGSTTYFGVKKGTYYIRTRCYSDCIYNVKYSFKKVSQSKKGSKQSNAVEIKAGKKVTGVFPATGKTQTHWYKVRLTKKKVFKLSVKTLNTDSVKLQVIPANKRYTIIGDTVRFSSSTKAQSAKSQGSWNAGVYYLKVTNNTKLGSGYYQITYKK